MGCVGAPSFEAPFLLFCQGECQMTRKRLPTKEKRISLPVFSVVTGLALCLLVGCGGGGGGTTTSTGAPEPDISCRPGGNEECQSVRLPDTPNTHGNPDYDEFVKDEPDPNEDPTNMPDRPGGPDRPEPPPTTLPTGLVNQDKFVLVGAPRAWFSTRKMDGYTGDGSVIGVMEEVNSFHWLFTPPAATNLPSKIHMDSVLASLYPEDLPDPPGNLIVNDEFTEYPAVPCLLQFEEVDACPDMSGQTKYFLRKNNKIYVLPGLRDPNPGNHDCPTFQLEDRRTPLCSEFGTSHGTGVASVAAAYALTLMQKDMPNAPQSFFRGIAYDAEILVYARPLMIAGLPANFNDHAAYFRGAPEEADVYNFSHTFGTPVTSVDESFFRNSPRGLRVGYEAIARAIGETDIPLIAATGNEGENFPRFPAALPAFFSDLRGLVLAVTATDDNGRITRYANRCGILPSGWASGSDTYGRHYCLAAPGGVSPGDQPFWVAGPGNDEFSTTSGTSFATPVVAGAFAILMERFRGTEQLNAKQIAARLVNTADNRDRTGEGGADYSDVAVYGAGLLDIENAIMPVGTERMSMSGDIDGGITYDIDVTSLSTSAAFGDALQRAFQTHEIATFDELDAPFWYPLSSLVTTTSSRETLQQRHARLFEHDNAPVETAGGGRFAFVSTRAGSSEQIDMSLRQPVGVPAAQAELLLTAGDLSTSPFGLHEDESFAHPYLGFAGEGVGLGGSLQLGTGRLTAMGFTSGSASVAEDVPVDARGGLVEYAIEPFAGVAFGMQAGAMVEESRALGLLSEGGFGEMGESSTAFAGVSLDGALEENWRFRASMLFGRTNLDAPSIGLLKDSSTLTSSAFRFALEGSGVLLDSDRIDVFVAQPLRIEGGEADFTVPVGRTPSGLVRRERINGVSLEPGGRELEFGARYEMQVREDIIATGGLGIVHEGGHSKGQETEFYGLANLRFHF